MSIPPRGWGEPSSLGREGWTWGWGGVRFFPYTEDRNLREGYRALMDTSPKTRWVWTQQNILFLKAMQTLLRIFERRPQKCNGRKVVPERGRLASPLLLAVNQFLTQGPRSWQAKGCTAPFAFVQLRQMDGMRHALRSDAYSGVGVSADHVHVAIWHRNQPNKKWGGATQRIRTPPSLARATINSQNLTETTPRVVLTEGIISKG